MSGSGYTQGTQNLAAHPDLASTQISGPNLTLSVSVHNAPQAASRGYQRQGGGSDQGPHLSEDIRGDG